MSVQFAKGFSSGDWTLLRSRIDGSDDPQAWSEAWTVFDRRLEERYFPPIRAIKKLRANAGEGFSIVAITCMLIELLESTYQGRTYQPGDGKSELPGTRYSSSRQLFTDFLTREVGLRKKDARSFFSNVRCKLLHECRTAGWRIRAKGPLLDREGTLFSLNRNRLLEHVRRFAERTGQEIRDGSNPGLGEKFLRRCDDLFRP
jgi:hypothetical protein